MMTKIEEMRARRAQMAARRRAAGLTRVQEEPHVLVRLNTGGVNDPRLVPSALNGKAA